jgi:cyclophilin family peptidyl-prolyl cis-trans isomerase/HEAT repeat protein
MKYRVAVYLSLLLLTVYGSACMPYQEEEFIDVSIDLRDTVIQEIYTFQNRQQTDSLLSYFSHRNPAYRYHAAVAFGSIKAKPAIDTLASLLKDRVDAVRAGAAYALGQIGDVAAEPYLIEAFDRYDTIGRYAKANRAILEAIGKCGTPGKLVLLSTVSTYTPRDTALLEGQAWGIYRYALRDIISPEGTRRMVELATNEEYPIRVRLIAANYLYRARNIQLDSTVATKIARIIANEEDPRHQMALAIGLGKTGSPTALDALINLYNVENDYRVRCNILRGLGNFGYAEVQETAMAALHHPNTHISIRAAQYFLDHGIPQDATAYWRMTRDSLPWQSQVMLYAATLRHLPGYYADYRDAINSQLRNRFRRSTSPFEQILILEALTEWPWNFRNIHNIGFRAETPIVREAAVRALATVSADPRNTPGFSSRRITRELAYYFREAIESGDPAMMGPAAEALTQSGRNFRRELNDLDFLENAIVAVDPTRDFSTHRSLKKALYFLESNENPPPEEMPFKSIDWSLLTASTIEPMVLIHTTKGVIHVRLLPKIAPATVSNFLQLIGSGYYQEKYFYRVVPNFVIQGAASLTHDPVGFTIRSELPPVHFDEGGLVGMASSGNHTESTQFFITHSPALHLDGNYTIFGRVTDGMEVVHKIQEGDQIETIIIQ